MLMRFLELMESDPPCLVLEGPDGRRHCDAAPVLFAGEAGRARARLVGRTVEVTTDRNGRVTDLAPTGGEPPIAGPAT